MVNRHFRRAVFGVTTALFCSVSMGTTLPAMANVVEAVPDASTSICCSDQTFLGGLDLAAMIITTVEQNQKSPYVNTGLAAVDDYLNIRKEPNTDAELVGKLYRGSGCDILSYDGEWVQIKSGDCEGYVKSEYLLTGTDAEDYAAENKISEIIAKPQEKSMYLYAEADKTSDILATVVKEHELSVLETTDDHQWMQVSVNDQVGYVPADTVELNIKYEAAVSIEEEKETENSKEKETEAVEETEKETVKETEKETEKQTETEKVEETEKVSMKDADETVWATYSVSIRKSYSENSEKLGVLVGSYSIKRTGICENGWSQVDYNGETAYIKSEYLTTKKPANADGQTQTETKVETISEQVYTTAGVNVRSKASTDADVLGTVIAGDGITRTAADQNGWSRVDYNGQTGYIKSEYLTTKKPAAPTTESSSSSKSDITEVKETVYTTAGVNVRKDASADSEKLGTVIAGGSITRTGKTSSGWSRVDYNGQTGYIMSQYLTTTKPAQETTESQSSSSSNSSLGQKIADFAVQYVGYPYVYGGNSLTGGVDCSGFTQQVYLKFGYSIPRRASIQATIGKTVSISNLQPGDLVFYGDSTGVGHVVIYIGNNKVVHASTPSTGIIISNLYYRTPMFAKRII